MNSLLLCTVVTALLLNLGFVGGHGRLMDPPSRSSLWRYEEFRNLDPPPAVNENDNELFCGGFHVQHELNGGKCGLCGDPFNQSRPRDNEDGGMYGLGIIARRYRMGQVIPALVEVTAPHWGYWELRLCPKTYISEDCFERHRLKFAGTSDTKFHVHQRPDEHESKSYSVSVELPKGIRCKRCVLQWHYHTGNRWGECEDGSGAVGCGPQETFRGCADISIE